MQTTAESLANVLATTRAAQRRALPLPERAAAAALDHHLDTLFAAAVRLLDAPPDRIRFEVGRDLAPTAWVIGGERHAAGIRIVPGEPVPGSEPVAQVLVIHAVPTATLMGRFLGSFGSGLPATAAASVRADEPHTRTPVLARAAFLARAIAANRACCACRACALRRTMNAEVPVLTPGRVRQDRGVWP